jgi:choline dehydrogenase
VPPVIRANYLQARADVDALVRGVDLARAFGGSPAYHNLRGEEIEPGRSCRTAADLARFVRQKADSIYHASGTCRMGPASDSEAVVSPELRVHGIEGLRVIDASVMPGIVNAPTHAACVMIGEKGAALVSGLQ